jgi:RNA-directed DNA polymerase
MGITINGFPEQTRAEWPKIKQSILKGAYKPSPVKRVDIPKRYGGKRPLGIPTVLDRLMSAGHTPGFTASV